MSDLADFGDGRRAFSSSAALADFVSQPGLPFSEVLSPERIFCTHKNLFGRIVLQEDRQSSAIDYAIMGASRIVCGA